MDISVVIPCYKSSKTIGAVVEEIEKTMDAMSVREFEIILVNDCSPDGGETLAEIRRLCGADRHVKGVDLAKNSGQAAATMAGLAQASGELVAVGDDDGQTPYESLFNMRQKLEDEKYDIVCAHYEGRGRRSLFRRFGSWMASAMSNYTLETPKNVAISVFFIARRFVIQEMLRYNRPYPFIIGLIAQTTHNIGNVLIDQRERASGQSGYTFTKLLSMWMNGLTAFSVKPLRLSSIIGFLCAAAGFITGAVTIIRKLLYPDILAGYTTLLAAILLVGGIIMLILGLIGEYVGRIYICINNRPQYVVKELISGAQERSEHTK